LKNKVDRLRVAIDGPAASGKNTLAKQIAKKYKLLHLDSGKLYRYFALQVYQSKDQKVNYSKLKQALKKLTLKKLKDKRLTTEPVTKIASIISKKKKIRQMLKKVQHDLAYNPPKKFRKISSLKPAKDAVLLDSSFYNTKAAFVEIDEVIRNKIKLLNATKHKSL